MHVCQPHDLMRLMYTSGTTDRPKGVMLTYENIYWKSADQTLALGLNADTRLLVVGPLYHVGALDLPGIAVPSKLSCGIWCTGGNASAQWNVLRANCDEGKSGNCEYVDVVLARGQLVSRAAGGFEPPLQ